MSSTSTPSLNKSATPFLAHDRSVREEHDGWIFVHVEGTPYARGWQHGRHLAKEIRAAISAIDELLWMDTATRFDWWAANARAMWHDMMATDNGGRLKDNSGSRLLEELRGIADGANTERKEPERWISVDDLLGWNGYPEMICQWFPAVQSGLKPAVPLRPEIAAPGLVRHAARLPLFRPFHHHCSAFVATGDWTADRGVVAAHTTWQRFANGDSYNIILSLKPPHDEGYPILMQTAPGYLASSMDFGQNAAGVVAVSTSINGNGFRPDGLPYFVRARRAGQKATTIDEWVELFREYNNGGYANSWLLAETKHSRIATYELTMHHEERRPSTDSGALFGCNIPLSMVIRVQETGSSGYDDIRSNGARRVRFLHLLAKYKGQIDAYAAKTIISDHHDLYTKTEIPSSRTICGHIDNDDGRVGGGHGPYYPWGSLDGKVTTAALLKRNAFEARWGRACGTPFEAKHFFECNPQYEAMRHLTHDRPTRDWTEFRQTTK
jgi:hypothetical protein